MLDTARVAAYCPACRDFVDIEPGAKLDYMRCAECNGINVNLVIADGVHLDESKQVVFDAVVKNHEAYEMQSAAEWSPNWECGKCGLGFSLRHAYMCHMDEVHTGYLDGNGDASEPGNKNGKAAAEDNAAATPDGGNCRPAAPSKTIVEALKAAPALH